MYRVVVPASSANLGSGFDVLGLALGVYNEYSFEVSNEFSVANFAPKYKELSKNLVYQSYIKAFEYASIAPIKATITEVKREIPKSGGLGSSAACAVSGILGANLVMGNVLSINQMLEIATAIDGHPDNVAAALMGGLTACIKTANGFHVEKYSVSSSLRFMICYPDFYVSTELARGVLPKELPLKSVVENMSRIANLPRAFEKGDLSLIRECVKDNIHEPYRIKLIEEGDVIRSASEKAGAVAVISGSGAAMLVIADNDEAFKNIKETKTKHKWTFLEVAPCFEV